MPIFGPRQTTGEIEITNYNTHSASIGTPFVEDTAGEPLFEIPLDQPDERRRLSSNNVRSSLELISFKDPPSLHQQDDDEQQEEEGKPSKKYMPIQRFITKPIELKHLKEQQFELENEASYRQGRTLLFQSQKEALDNRDRKIIAECKRRLRVLDHDLGGMIQYHEEKMNQGVRLPKDGAKSEALYSSMHEFESLTEQIRLLEIKMRKRQQTYEKTVQETQARSDAIYSRLDQIESRIQHITQKL